MIEARPVFGRRAFLAGLAGLAGLRGGSAAELAESTNAVAAVTNRSGASGGNIANINSVLEPIRSQARLPALAAAVISGGRLSGVGATGIRKAGSPIRVRGTDLFHVGSCTKAMTATLIAMQVEKGRMRWDMTLGEVFPDWRNGMNPAYRTVTLEQLLTHRGGVPNQADDKLWQEAWAKRGTETEQRLAFVKGTLAKPPEAPPGTKYIYSNQGYSAAGAMLEKMTGQPWETLIREQLFRPLQMTSAGFGAPGTAGQLDQPWGHTWEGNKLKPSQVDNPPAIGPGGVVHCSIWDFAKFALLHLNGANGEGRLLKKETFTKLHTSPEGQDYAFGWSRQDRNWANGYTLNHAGSNTLNYAVIWIAPKIRFAAVAATNLGGEAAQKACDQTISALVDKYAKAAPAKPKEN